LAQVSWFQNFHRVLNRAEWSPLAASRILLGLLVAAFVPAGPVVVALDDTLERRRGTHIAAKVIYRDPVRSSQSHFVKVSGLRWVCLMLLVPIPWVGRVWALPFLTVLAPSARYHTSRGRRHKTLLDWALQLVLLLGRWYPTRALVLVADSTYAAIELLACCSRAAVQVTMITRLRLDAALYAPAPPPTSQHRVEIVSQTAVWYHSGKPPAPVRWVLIRDPKGAFPTQVLLCTAQDIEPAQILAWFVQRWQLEVTLEECHARNSIRPSQKMN
jgi:DDE superfamily endonuclease